MKLSELYTSVQGEGPHTGMPIQFVRFGGCNMRCPGWPCDTEYAIDPKYRHDWEPTSPGVLHRKLETWPMHVCITGGEPLIQPAEEMRQFVMHLLVNDWKVDLFTNGSRQLMPWCFSSGVTIVMDWKLGGSGEADTGIEMRKANTKQLQKKDAIKFVVTNVDDLVEAAMWTDMFEVDWKITAPLWVGAAWGHIDDEEIVEFIKTHQLPWRLNVQQHKHIWPRAEKGV